MKKLKLDPLELDKNTMAKLDEQQLQEIVGGAVEMLFATSGNCSTGSTNCTGGTSGACNDGGTNCFV